VQARNLFVPTDYPGAPRPPPLADTPVRFSETEAGIRRRAPTLGEHTDQILKELGYTDQEIAELHDKRVV
jgi:crotonobetainyl-CoA:carnitine CoA-transferase CaiB-like acyl-CoA transferase